jgi:hypothetical protein
MIWVELCILLVCILIGARLGGIGLGTVSGIGLVILVFAFKEPPGSPPQIVIGMIIAVITALATMQAVGGLDYLVEKVMRQHPRYITFIAPVAAPHRRLRVTSSKIAPNVYHLVNRGVSFHRLYLLSPSVLDSAVGARLY